MVVKINPKIEDRISKVIFEVDTFALPPSTDIVGKKSKIRPSALKFNALDLEPII